ncbi:MAG: hypothetical protein OEV27_06055 [Nitrospira sp.]|nr:hypothetical protein [Nitrospira sp.]MDH4250738.1 hypothetical protein [Nitrospira sp.]MDH4342491.1 hypothetical protein [Nitrospira sp.]MDH5335664.1 hypothetical protein [Nitrospira sp.]
MLRTWFDSYIIYLAETSRRPAAIVLAVLLQAGVPQLSDGAPGGKTEVLPMEKAAPAAVVIEAAGTEPELRRQMRSKNGVVELKSGAVRFSLAPTGSYGFIAPKQLGLALVTQSPDLMLEQVSSSSGSYEIHKLGNGSGLLVGFVGNEVVPQIKPSERPRSVRLFLYSNPFSKATTIAAVPLTKLMVDQMPHRIEPKQPDGPVLLEMDLQGTANRKAPSQ